MDIKQEIESWFPNIVGKSFKIKILDTSNAEKFNCVSFTLDIYDDWLWTNEKSWPIDIPRNLGIEGFKLLYEKYNYIECDSDIFEKGYNKVAFYGKNNESMHAAKQFGNVWKSKFSSVIVEHQLDWLC